MVLLSPIDCIELDKSVASNLGTESVSQCHLEPPGRPSLTGAAPVTSVSCGSDVMQGILVEADAKQSESISVTANPDFSSKQKHQCEQNSFSKGPCLLEDTFSDDTLFACQPKECPIVIELFAGSGRVTAHLKHVGIKSAFGVDHKLISKIAPIKIWDLTTRYGQKLCMEWCNCPLLAGVFIAPPCGTCSRAREIILRDSKGRPMPGPIPLRNDLHPNGIPFLGSVHRARVSSANKLYAFVAKLVKYLVSRDVPVVIENPRNSIIG